MATYYGAGGQPGSAAYGAAGAGAQNLQFYPSSYAPAVSGAATTTHQAAYGYPGPGGAVPGPGPQPGFAGPDFGVSGCMGEQGGLRTGWLAAFSTEGYDGEPPLWEELGVNFAHIQKKVASCPVSPSRPPWSLSWLSP